MYCQPDNKTDSTKEMDKQCLVNIVSLIRKKGALLLLLSRDKTWATGMSYMQQRNLALSAGWACFNLTSWQSCVVSNTSSMPAKALQPKHDSTCHSKEAQMNSRTLIPRAPHSLQLLAATGGSRWCFLSDCYRCGALTHTDKRAVALCLG